MGMSLMTVLGLAAALAAPAAAKIGLSSQFIDVEFEGLQPGKSYNLRELRGVPYTVRNRGDGTADVMVEAQIPKSVAKPYEAIPDVSWIELNPGRLRIDPQSLGFSDIVIRVPDDAALKGRHFEVKLWAHTVGTGLLSAGVNSRLRFSVGPGPETVAQRELDAAVVTLNYDLWPAALHLGKAKVGERYDAKASESRAFMLTNRADKTLELVPQAVAWPTGAFPLPDGGWETRADLSWVKFEPSTATVEGFTVKEVRVVLDQAPADLKGRKLAFLVQLKLPNGMVVNQTHRGFVTFPADAPAQTISAPEAPEKK